MVRSRQFHIYFGRLSIRFPDRIDMRTVRTEESTMILRCQTRLLKEWDLSSTHLGKANGELKEDQE